MNIDDTVSPSRTSDRFFGNALPLELGWRRASKVYLARLLTVVGAGAAVLLIGWLGTVAGMGEVLTVWVTALAVMTVWAVRRDFAHAQGRAARWRARFFLPTMFLLFTATAVVSGAWAVASEGSSIGLLVGVCLASMVSTFLLGKMTLVRAEVASEKTVEQSLQGVALTRTAQPLITALGDVVTASTPSDRGKAAEVLIRLTVSVGKAVCGRSLSQSVATRAIFYQLASDDVVFRRAYDGEYGGIAPRETYDARRSRNDRRVLEIAKGDRALVVTDLDAAPPDHFADYAGLPYKSYVAVPVRAGETSFGVLLIDSDTPNSLTDVDVGYAILMAGILGIGLAAADSPAGAMGETHPTSDLIGQVARNLDNVFEEDLPDSVVSFSLNPGPDRDVLRALHGLNEDELVAFFDRYWKALHALAEERAERGLRRMNHLSATMLLTESTEPAYRVPSPAYRTPSRKRAAR